MAPLPTQPLYGEVSRSQTEESTRVDQIAETEYLVPVHYEGNLKIDEHCKKTRQVGNYENRAPRTLTLVR